MTRTSTRTRTLTLTLTVSYGTDLCQWDVRPSTHQIDNCSVSILHIEFTGGEPMPIVTIPDLALVGCARHITDPHFMYPTHV